MRLPSSAAAALLLAVMSAAPGAGQTSATPADIAPVGSAIPADAIRDLPLGDTVDAILENTQAEVISDRFNSGGLNAGGDSRAGGFLGSWSQTLFRIGDVDVSDPSDGGESLVFPDTTLWQTVTVTGGLMPADINTPGLAVTLEPKRAGDRWTRMFSGVGSGGSLAAGAPADQPPPIARLKDFAHGSGAVSGPLSDRVSLTAIGTVAGGAGYSRERLASTRDSSATAFTHLVFSPTAAREWRLLGLVQRASSPFENWQPVRDSAAFTQDTSVHVQSTFEQHPRDAAQWRVFGGLTQRERVNSAAPSTIQIERIVNGPVANVVDSVADVTARRITLGARLEPFRAAQSRHRLAYGANFDHASTVTSGAFAGTVRESVSGVAARVWSYNTASTDSRRATSTASAFASDVIALSSAMTLDAGVRGEAVHGRADGAANAVTWISLLPHAYLRMQFSERRSLTVGVARSANALTHNWLAFGDPAGATARVVSAAAPNVLVARVGPGTGGNAAFSGIEPDVKRPYTDELAIGWEKRRSASTRYTLTGIARWERNLLGVTNPGVPASSYSTISVPDAGQDLVGPADDRTLLVYNRLPSSFGSDTYLVTNPEQDAARAFALRMSLEHSSERLFLLFGATASAAEGSGGNRGYGPLENDQDVPGELFANPNAATYARGRVFSDRAFTIKWTTLYRFPYDITVGGIARYQDGQPFSRLVVVPNLNQGTEAVQAYPNGGSRYTFTGTFDVRAQKGFRLGSGRLDAIFDAYNLFTRNNEVEEIVVSGPLFRTPSAIQPPRSLHLGLRLTF